MKITVHKVRELRRMPEARAEAMAKKLRDRYWANDREQYRLETALGRLKREQKQLRAALRPFNLIDWAKDEEAEQLREERQLARISQRIRGAVKRHTRRMQDA